MDTVKITYIDAKQKLTENAEFPLLSMIPPSAKNQQLTFSETVIHAKELKELRALINQKDEQIQKLEKTVDSLLNELKIQRQSSARQESSQQQTPQQKTSTRLTAQLQEASQQTSQQQNVQEQNKSDQQNSQQKLQQNIQQQSQKLNSKQQTSKQQPKTHETQNKQQKKQVRKNKSNKIKDKRIHTDSSTQSESDMEVMNNECDKLIRF